MGEGGGGEEGAPRAQIRLTKSVNLLGSSS
jgi:hypothetical protein